MTFELFEHRLKCRANNSKKNEVQVKLALFDLIQLVMRPEF